MANQPFADIPQDVPVYELLAPCFLEDDTLHETGEQIAYLGVPNEYMAPLNEPAKVEMRKFLTYLDDCAREKAEMMGRRFTGRLRDTADEIGQALSDAKIMARRAEIVMPQVPDGPIPATPAMVPMAQRQAKIRKRSKVLARRAPQAQPQKPVARPISTLGNYETAPIGGGETT